MLVYRCTMLLLVLPVVVEREDDCTAASRRESRVYQCALLKDNLSLQLI